MERWAVLVLAATLGGVPAGAQTPAPEAALLLAVASERAFSFDAAQGPPLLSLRFSGESLLPGSSPGRIVLVEPAKMSELPKSSPVLLLVPDATFRQSSPPVEYRFKDVCGGFWRADVSKDGKTLRLSPFAAAYVVNGPLIEKPSCSLLRNTEELDAFLKKSGFTLPGGEALTPQRINQELGNNQTPRGLERSRSEEATQKEFDPIRQQLEQQELMFKALPAPAAQNVPPSIRMVP